MYIKKQFRQSEIYGITGRKGHGKDTFATEVAKAHEALVLARSKSSPKRPFGYTHFAEALKSMSGRIFGLTREQMYDPALKEAQFPVPIDMDLYVVQMRRETGLPDLQPEGKIAHSAREVMQFFGTDYVRKTQNDYWVQRTMAFARTQRRVLIPDARFPNEALAVRNNGGRVIKIVRLGASDSGDAHASETEIDKIDPDLLLMVKTGDLSLVTRVATLIALGKFEAALKYDWRKAEKAMNAYASGVSAEESARFLGSHNKDPQALYNLLAYYERPRRGRQSPSRMPHQVVDGMTVKGCSVCSYPKPLADFNRSSKAWDGLAGLCRACAATKNKASYQTHSLVDSLERVFHEFKKRAPQRGLAFNITLQDLKQLWSKQQGRCYYSGVALTTEVGDPNKVSIDRADSNKDYAPDNVVLCTKRLNLMKREMSTEEFLTVILRVSLNNFPMLHKTREEVLKTLRS